MTNEQRAHDLAIKSLEFVKANIPNEGKFDIYLEYLNLYKQILDLLNRDFPSGL